MPPNHYKTLGISETASVDEIKKAYRKLARQYHPDVSQEKDASERIKAVNEAYHVLSDADKKRQYDYARQQDKRGPSFHWPPASSQAGFQGFNDVFDSYFKERNRRRSRLELTLPLHLEQVFQGGSTPIQVKGNSLSIDLPAGIEDGAALQLTNILDGQETDIILNISYLPHAEFKVEDGHVFSTVLLRPWQTGPGSTVLIDTLAGKVQMQVPAGVTSGQKLRLKGRGMPKGSNKPGDHFVTIQIQAPSPKNEEQIQVYLEMKRLFENP